MSRYLLDTNVCIEFFKRHAKVASKLENLESGSLFISEITLVELRIGALKSVRPDFHNGVIADLLDDLTVLPISAALDLFIQEKVRLSRSGTMVDNFDLLIGATAIHHDLTLVTNNTKHFQRLEGIKMEDWTK